MAWVVSAAAAASILLFAIFVLWLLVGSLRFPAPPMAQDSPAAGAATRRRQRPRARRSTAKLTVALLLSLMALALALFGMASDMEPPEAYQLAWLIALPAAGALGASALLLVLLSLPRGARSGAEEPLAWLLALGVLGIGACYGRFLL